MAKSTLIFHNGNCINTKKPFAKACRLCNDHCPHQAISEYRELDASKCTECGMCMAICPSDGFVDRTMDELHEYLFQNDSEEIVLNCPLALPHGYEISCLGMFDRDAWSVFMLLARRKKVRILTGNCADCPDKVACAKSVSTFMELHNDWPEHPPIYIEVRPDTEDAPVRDQAKLPRKPLARRNLLQGFRKLGRDKVNSLLPRLTAEETYTIPRTRQWLAEALQGAPEVKVPFLALCANESCTSCGVCVSICPQSALEKREAGEAMRLIFEPLKCVQCNRCTEVCQVKALNIGVKPFSKKMLTGKILLHEGNPRYCSRCGKQIFDNSEPPLCLACTTSNPDRRDFFL